MGDVTRNHRAGIGQQRGRMAGVPSDSLAAAIDELYALDPDVFTAVRTRRVAEAKAAGDRLAAKQIAALRRPTRSAWLVNRLVREDPAVAAQLTELSTELVQAQRDLDGDQLRELSGQRRRLIEALTRRAVTATGTPAPTVAVREEVSATLEASLADPSVAEQLSHGTLLRAARWAGFGTAGPDLQIVPSPRPRSAAPSAGIRSTAGGGADEQAQAVARARAEAATAHAEAATAQAAAARRDRERERQREQRIAQAEQVLTDVEEAMEAARRAQVEAKQDVRRAEEDLAAARRRADAAAADLRTAAARRTSAQQSVRAAHRR
ncbi:MAG: hypothetical protein M3140_06045 [Actinomycetota bacterium]|nr:hypothetical protein [Actinomycetota bacterium]